MLYDIRQAANNRVNNSVFSRFLKASSDVDQVTVGDRLFYTRTAATGTAQSSIDECLVQETINDAVNDESMRRPVFKFEARWSWTVRYCRP